MIQDLSELASNLTATADVVVVGSGAGGAPMAWRLAAGGLRVILLEEGRQHDTKERDGDAMRATADLYRDNGAVFTIGNPPIPLPLGRTLGGTTVINSGTCFRLPEKVLRRWKSDLGLSGLEYPQLTVLYDQLEQYLNVIETPIELMGANNHLFMEGAKALGLNPRPIRRNQRDCMGRGKCVFGCPEGAKQSMDRTFIPDAIKAGVTVITSARVTKVLMDKGRVAGVSGRSAAGDGKATRFTVNAPKVVLSCGAVHTPLLLLRNGLGNKSGQVGRNLRIHPAAKVIAMFNEEIRSYDGVPQAVYADDLSDEGIMFEGFFLPPQLMSVALPGDGRCLKEYMAAYNQMAGFGIMVSDSSHGRVRRGLGGSPLLTYDLNREDFARFIKGIDVAARVYLKAGAREVLLPVHGIPPIRNEADLELLNNTRICAADLELTAFHPLGTCRMGDDARLSVVGPSLESHDISGLYIADASVLPTGLGVNPQMTIMALSLRAAGLILESHEKSTTGITNRITPTP
jgi:choline dehydrogenase-like flavoprotein